MPLTWALSLTVTNWRVMVPVLLAVAVNGSMTAHVLPAGGGEDVEVGQDLGPVDEDVEDPGSGRRPVLLGEVQADRVGRAGGEAGDGVAEVAVAVVLVDRLGRGVGQAGGGDRVSGVGGRAAGEVLIGRERRGRRAASRDINAARRHRRRRRRVHLRRLRRRSGAVGRGDRVVVRGAVGQPGVSEAVRRGRSDGGGAFRA